MLLQCAHVKKKHLCPTRRPREKKAARLLVRLVVLGVRLPEGRLVPRSARA